MEICKIIDNLSVLECKVLNILKGRKDIIIKKVDKNNMCVIFNKSDYIKECECQLNSKYYCKIIDFNFRYFNESIMNKLLEMNDNGVFDKVFFDFFWKVENMRLGRLYLFLKIYKFNIEIFNKIKNNGCCNVLIILLG